MPSLRDGAESPPHNGADSPSLPTLSDADAKVLLALLIAEDPDAEAASLGLSPRQAFELMASPAAERYLAARARFDALRRERRQDPIRDEMLTVLRTVAKDEARDPVERRLAASAALRTLDPWRSTNALLRALARSNSPRPAAALKDRAGAPGSAPAPATAPPKHGSPAHLFTSSPAHPLAPSPSHPLPPSTSLPPEPILDHPATPCSAFPGLTTTVTEFLAKLASSGGAPAALPLVAAHIKNRRGHDAVLTWLESIRATIQNTDPRPGTFIYDDDYDTAVHHVALASRTSSGTPGGTGPASAGPVRGTDGPAPSGAPVSPAPDGSVSSSRTADSVSASLRLSVSPCLVSCVLERDRDQVPGRWAVTGFTVAVTADSS